MRDLEALLQRVRAQKVGADDHLLVEKLIGSYAYLSDLVSKDKTTIAELQRLLGKTPKTTEKTRDVVTSKGGSGKGDKGKGRDKSTGKGRKGHGRNAAADYEGATNVSVGHQAHAAGDPCPKPRCNGTLYKQKKPAVLIRITGQAPLHATAYQLERLRCNVCGEIHTADAPEGVGDDKYDAKSAAMIALLKYGSGLPFNRIAGLQGALRIPLPASTQWDVVRHAASLIRPLLDELIVRAAQGKVIYVTGHPKPATNGRFKTSQIEWRREPSSRGTLARRAATWRTNSRWHKSTRYRACWGSDGRIDGLRVNSGSTGRR